MAYAYTDTSVVATDLATTSRRWLVPLPGPANLVTGVDVVPEPMPAVVTDGTGHEVIVAAYLVVVAGSGTQQDTEQVQVRGINTNGTVRRRHTVHAPLAGALQPARIVDELHDAQGAAVVLYTGDMLVLDSGSGPVRWDVPQVDPADVDGDTVVGVRAGADETTSTVLACAAPMAPGCGPGRSVRVRR
jgi:hypothetical protein